MNVSGLTRDGSSACSSPTPAQDPLGLLLSAPIALVLVSPQGIVLDLNTHAATTFGFSQDEVRGEPLSLLSSRKAPGGADHPWLHRPEGPLLSRSSEEDDLQLRGCRKNGESFPLELGLARVTLRGEPVFLLSMVDLSVRRAVERRLVALSIELAQRSTELENRGAELQAEIEQRRRAEADLQRSREDFRYLFEHNPLPMYLYNPQTMRFLEVNEAACELYGYTHEEFQTLRVSSIHPPDEVDRMHRTALEKMHLPFFKLRNWRHRAKDGRNIEVDTYSHALGAGPEAVRLVVVVDVTERNAAEMQLRQSQKMEAIGQLTGGVAHDFNNLLTIILGNLELIAEECADSPSVRAMTADALASVQRGSSLTKRLLAFSRQQSLEPRVLRVDQLVNDMAGLFRRSLGENINIRHFLAPDLWRICVDASQLENALLNLAVNARDAMPEGGNLTLEAQNAVLDNDYVLENPDAAPGEYVQIAVSDSGTGMPPEVLEHILEPFFTTKPVGKGTGLGLSMVYGLIKQSGGHLKIYSEQGRGTTVKMYLPRAQGEPDAGEGAALRSVMPRSEGHEVVLLVEDDDTIRKLVERLLTMLGYQTLTAADAHAALQVLSAAPHVDLLFTDVVLPNGMSGATLAAEAQLRHPALKVLYMSGYTRNALVHNGHDDTSHLLSKPFRREELARAIHRVLHSV